MLKTQNHSFKIILKKDSHVYLTIFNILLEVLTCTIRKEKDTQIYIS